MMRTERMTGRRMSLSDRKRQVRRYKIGLYTLIFLTALVIGIFSVRAFAYADEHPDGDRVKCYRSITIYAGDSLYELSTNYLPPEYSDPVTYAREIAFINHMDIEAALIPGNHLILPYYKEAADPAVPEAEIPAMKVTVNDAF